MTAHIQANGPVGELSGMDAFFRNMPDAFFLMRLLLDAEGQPQDMEYLYANEAVFALTRMHRQEFIGRLFSEIFGIPAPGKWLKPYYEAACHGMCRTWQDYSEEIQEYVEITCFPVEPCYTGCFVKNVTKKTLYSRTINSSRLAYREIYFIDLDRDQYQMIFPLADEQERGCYTQAIRKHFANGKIRREDGASVARFLSPAHIRQTLADRDSMEYKYQRMAPDGSTEWCLTSISVCERADGQPATVSMSVRSIEDIVRADERQQQLLSQALEQARKASNAKSDFLSSMSHDMRTPLNVITGMTTLARIHGDDPELVRDCLEKIDVSGRHLLALVNGVLDMAKIENGEIELDETAFSLSDMMEGIVLMTQSIIASKHQILNFSVQALAHEAVIGDGNRLSQALLNVLTNAVKYTDRHGRIQMDIRELGCDGRRAVYRFTVQDNGCGMSEDFLRQAFEPFAREVDMRLNKVAGTGLGLAITKQIIDAMGGSIQVSSQVGQGSIFTIQVPLTIQDKRLTESSFPDERLLIVDDYAPCADSIRSVVEALGAKCEAISSGAAALQCLAERQGGQRPFTAVLTDYVMPDMDGVTLAREIRRRFGDALPIILASAYDYSMVKKDAGRAGVNFFCTKPIFRSRLLQIFPGLHNREILAQESRKLEKRQARRLRALLAEDNMLNAEIARNLLEHLGLEVELAEDGKEAVDLYRQSPLRHYDCVFMDVQMPVMNGLAAARAIRALEREDAGVPIFAMTANVFAEDMRRTREAGMQEHIGKPIDLAQIQYVLERHFPDWTAPDTASQK